MLRGHIVRFGKRYGEVVICCDARSYWRKDAFPYYKGTRPKKGERDPIWDECVYPWMDQIKQDLRDYFPYKILQVDKCEADDVIGFLCEKYHGHEEMMVVSRDKDFRQLQRYSGVAQYDPISNKAMKEPKPLEYLREHIIRGDGGDAVVNIFSDLDTFMTEGKRQKNVSSKKMAAWLGMTKDQFCADTGVKPMRYDFNKLMVDLEMIPTKHKQAIADAFDSTEPAPRAQVLKYLMKHKMRHLTEHLSDF